MIISINDINFYQLFDEINKECFNNELPKIEILIGKMKNTSGYYHRTRSRITGEIIKTYIKISSLFNKTKEHYKNILAHEMIHQFIAINYPNEREHHGRNFMLNMHRLNNLGYKISIIDDIETELDETIKIEERLFIIFPGKPFYFILTKLAFFKINKDKYETFFKRYGFENYETYITTDPIVMKLRTIRTIKINSINSKYAYIITDIINSDKTKKINL